MPAFAVFGQIERSFALEVQAPTLAEVTVALVAAALGERSEDVAQMFVVEPHSKLQDFKQAA